MNIKLVIFEWVGKHKSWLDLYSFVLSYCHTTSSFVYWLADCVLGPSWGHKIYPISTINPLFLWLSLWVCFTNVSTFYFYCLSRWSNHPSLHSVGFCLSSQGIIDKLFSFLIGIVIFGVWLSCKSLGRLQQWGPLSNSFTPLKSNQNSCVTRNTTNRQRNTTNRQGKVGNPTQEFHQSILRMPKNSEIDTKHTSFSRMFWLGSDPLFLVG